MNTEGTTMYDVFLWTAWANAPQTSRYINPVRTMCYALHFNTY